MKNRVFMDCNIARKDTPGYALPWSSYVKDHFVYADTLAGIKAIIRCETKKPLTAPVTLNQRVRAAVVTLNNHYGYGDVLKVKVFMDGDIHFTVQGYMMRPQLRRGHLDGNTVHILRHQRAI